MEATAKVTYVRIAPRKVQIVLDLIRGKDVETAMEATVKQPSSTTKTETSSFKPYMITVTADKLNVRKEPVYDPTDKNVTYVITKSKPGPYTIVEEKNGWGKLKSGIGWINLKYTKKYVAKK